MPKVTIKSKSKVDIKETFQKVCKLLETDRDLHKLDPSYQCEFQEDGYTGSARGKLFKATMVVIDEPDGPLVELKVDLPLALTLAKGMVAKTLQKKLDAILG